MFKGEGGRSEVTRAYTYKLFYIFYIDRGILMRSVKSMTSFLMYETTRPYYHYIYDLVSTISTYKIEEKLEKKQYSCFVNMKSSVLQTLFT